LFAVWANRAVLDGNCMFKKFQLLKWLGRALNKGARNPFVVFLILFFAGAAASVIIFFVFRQSYLLEESVDNPNSKPDKLFNKNKSKEYQDFFASLEMRERDHINTATTTISYDGIFQ
jgi:hypothetical protein